MQIAYDEVQEMLDNETEEGMVLSVDGIMWNVTEQSVLRLELEVKRLFNEAEAVFAEDNSAQRVMKKLFYVGYVLRQFDEDRKRVRISLQWGENEAGCTEVFLRTCWDFDHCVLRIQFDSNGFPDYEFCWTLNVSYIKMDILQDLPSVDSSTENCKTLAEELSSLWESFLCTGFLEARL